MLWGLLALGRHHFGISPGYPEKINPDPRDFGISGIFHSGFFQDFLGIFSGFFKGFKIPVPIPGILRFSGFFLRNFQISIPFPGISGFSRFFDLAQNKKSRFRIPGIGIWDPEKIPSRSQLCPERTFSWSWKYLTLKTY